MFLQLLAAWKSRHRTWNPNAPAHQSPGEERHPDDPKEGEQLEASGDPSEPSTER